MVKCPICARSVKEFNINSHIDSECTAFVDDASIITTQYNGSDQKTTPVSSFFRTPSSKNTPPSPKVEGPPRNDPVGKAIRLDIATGDTQSITKRGNDAATENGAFFPDGVEPSAKRAKSSNLQKVAPLAERMRPRTLDEVYGQELVGPNGVLRGLIESDRVPSMILWGGAGTGKTTIARLIANIVGCRFTEINSTSSGVGECKNIFAEARSELGLTGRKTILVSFFKQTVLWSRAEKRMVVLR